MVSTIMNPRVGVLTGPTATGKSSLALHMAQRYPSLEIIQADSLTVYRYFDLGTAKPTQRERQKTPHHLIDIVDPPETFTAGEFVRRTQSALKDIHQRGNRALIVGGSSFYLKALLWGLWQAPASEIKLQPADSQNMTHLFQMLQALDPEAAQRIQASDHYRIQRALEIIQKTGKTLSQLQKERPLQPDLQFQVWIVDRHPIELNHRILMRTRNMLHQGLVEETQTLMQKFPQAWALQSVGYAQVCAYLQKKTPQGRQQRPGLLGLEDEIILATQQLIKRQRTYLRRQLPSQTLVNPLL